MFGIPILEVAIGLSLVYLLLALVCMTVNETIASVTRRRAKILKEQIGNVLCGDTALTQKLYAHPLIASLKTSRGSHGPSYIPSSLFALSLMNILSGKDPSNGPALRAGIKGHPHENLKEVLNTVLCNSSTGTTDQHKIETWFEDCMDRVSGAYKRNSQSWSLLLALVVTVALNADTLRITHTLWVNQAVRSAVVEAAQSRARMEKPEELLPTVEYKNPDKPDEGTAIQPNNGAALTSDEYALLGRLTGWSVVVSEWHSLGDASALTLLRWWARMLLGLLMTTFAVSLGAPFWFDTLNRFMNLRGAGRATDEPRNKSGPAPAANGR